MKMLAGSIVVLSAAVLASAALLRTASQNADLVPMSLGASALGALCGAALIVAGMREDRIR